MITESLSTLKIHKLTQAQYDRELAAGNIDPNALYLTPDETQNYVYVVDIVNDLTTDVVNKPLSAAQGVALKTLIDSLQTLIDDKADKSEIDAKMIEAKEYADTQIQNITVTSEKVFHNGSKLSDTLDTQ